jgi:hypothetical protein
MADGTDESNLDDDCSMAQVFDIPHGKPDSDQGMSQVMFSCRSHPWSSQILFQIAAPGRPTHRLDR